MELEKVLHMKGGSGDTSYGQAVYVTRTVISMTKPRREEAITELITKNDLTRNGKAILCIADLGCASGPNTLTVVSDLVIISERIRRESGQRDPMEYQIYLNDLPGNDFNTVFQSLPKFHQAVKKQTGLEGGQVFVGAMPGSYYGRLFPTQSLHFVHSSYSLHWLSQVPNGLEDCKQNIFISSTSPKNMVKAYKEQFHKDSQMFFTSRSTELIKGGKMLLTYLGRSSEDPINIECCYFWDSLAHYLSELVYQGNLEQEKLETFKVPLYYPSSLEVIEEVQKEGSFYINNVDVSQVSMIDQENGNNSSDELQPKLSKLLGAIFGPVLISHFGEAITEKILPKYSSIIKDGVAKHNILISNVTISLTKK